MNKQNDIIGGPVRSGQWPTKCFGKAGARAILYPAAAGFACAIALPQALYAQATPAGTSISNTAEASYTINGDNSTSTTISSNEVTFKVDELLNVTVTSQETGDVSAAAGAADQVMRFKLTNSGNGNEAFTLSAVRNVSGDDFDPSGDKIYIDDGDGIFDASSDTLYIAGSNDPTLDQGDAVTIFVLSSIGSGETNESKGKVQFQASAKTGSGTPGTAFVNQGDNGVTAVVGTTGAKADGEAQFVVRAVSVVVDKSYTVANQFGQDDPVPGATITYQLKATVKGSGSVSDFHVTDAIPGGTNYVPGSITLDGATLTDTADADKGSYTTADGIAVDLGTVSVANNNSVDHIITFQVKIAE